MTALWNDLREQVSLVKGGKRSAGQGSFGHIVGGYDAGYYGWVLEVLCIFSLLQWTNRYTYSLVFAADMYSTVFKSDPLDPARGDRYRRSILRPGGSREELDSLEVKDVISSIDIETERFLGIPWARPKSGCIYGGNIREFIKQ